MSSISDESLLLEFVAEAKEHLDAIEPDLLILEKEGSQTSGEVVNRVFRAIHSIKGAAGFFGFEALKRLSHIMESVLMLIRDGKLEPASHILDTLFIGVDKLNLMLEDIHSSDQVACQEVVNCLESILKGEPVPEQASSAPKIEEPAAETEASELHRAVDDAILNDIARHGHSFYLIDVYTQVDLLQKNRSILEFMQHLGSIGSLLNQSFNKETLPDVSATEQLQFFFASVLEEDLVAAGCDISVEQIRKLESDAILSAPASEDSTSVASQTAKDPAPEALPQITTPPEITAKEPKEASRKAPPAPVESNETVRVRVDLLNKLMDLAGEMVLSRNQLIRTLGSETNKITGLGTIIQNVDLITSDLQEHIMQTRMQPIGNVFGKFPRVVRDMSRQLNKSIELQMTGEDVELDKSIVESLSDPLTHLVRNCCDHAIELPEEREKAGKSATGTIVLRAFHEGGQINISIQDDGHGIDHQKIAAKALASKLVDETLLKKMTPQEIVNMIFLPGLSTAEKVSDISGRGVGMDVVKTNIEKMGGNISIDTSLGKGTTILLRLPLTLAIIPSLIVGVAHHRFAMPQINLVELVCVRASEISSRIEKVGSANVLRLRGKLLPLLRLSDVLGIKRLFTDPVTGEQREDRRTHINNELSAVPEENPADSGVSSEKRRSFASDYYILVLKIGANQYGLIVDEVLDTEEIVVKPLSGYLKNCKCFAGATIMGDGRVAMILDAGGILAYTKLSFAEVDEEERRRREEKARTEKANAEKQSVVLFNNAENERFALPLSSILRLEKFDVDQIERVSGREFITYRGRGLPLVRLENHLPVGASPAEAQHLYLIIPKVGDGAAGIVASHILDTTETEVNLDKTLLNYPGVNGSALVNDHLTLFIDPQGLLEQAGILTTGDAYVR